jgi:hypothetical protein
MSKKITYNEYDVSFTLRLGPEKITNIPKLEKALTDILGEVDITFKIHDAVETAVGLVVVHDRDRISHMHMETTPVKIVPKKTGQRASG